jgi:UDP-GlcNAc:undecaprenyl-phosphate/decaprenyl-phosphate GlcNAc-1-phosphate transferase
VTNLEHGLIYVGGARIPYSLLLFLASLLLSLLLTPLVRALARRIGAFDQPGPRRIHDQPVPTLGGLAIAASVLGVAWASFLLPGPVGRLGIQPLLGFTVASIPILAMGVVDDLRGVRPLAKLGVQVVSGLILVLFGYGVPVLSTPMGGAIDLGPLGAPLTIVWVLLITNAINLIDGLDGLAAGAVFIASMSLWWVGRSHMDLYVMFLTAVMAGATLGFLRSNFPPARIFMGDTGSQFLGLALAAMSLIENRKGTVTLTLLFPLVTLGLPVFDSALAFVRRWTSGRPVFRADSEHVHHRLLRLGLQPRQAVLVLWYLCFFLGVMAVVVEALPHTHIWFVLALLAMGIFMAFQVLEFVDHRMAEREEHRAERRGEAHTPGTEAPASPAPEAPSDPSPSP